MHVIITGASGHLGRAILDSFLQAGHRVAAIDRHEAPAERDGLHWLRCADLSSPSEVEPALASAKAWLGDIDALVLVAGAFAWAELAESSPELWQKMFAANVLTTVVPVRASLPLLKDGAAIVAIGAASAQPAGAGMAAYAAAKSAVARLIEATAEEMRPRGIRANVVLPRIIDTPQNRRDMPDADPADWTSPDAIAAVVQFLAGPQSRAINGAGIPVTNASKD
jgi:NAD(P)-dependent dehydrogenase (short-subunit alcohol dehydrogenase family)